MDLNYSFSATLVKSGDETSTQIPITIIPNQPTKDRQNDKIVLKAFDEDCINGFLHDGVIDYDHISLLGKTALEKAEAIIGQPESFFVDEKRGVPVCNGFLFRGNKYVDNVILPALMANSKVFGASLGGRILQKSMETDPKEKTRINTITKISLKHIAITPLQKAVHQGTIVKLRKSEDDTVEGADLHFDDFDMFIKSVNDEDLLQKALIAGTASDIAQMSGGQVLQSQSLEGANNSINKERIKYSWPFILDDLIKGEIGGKTEDYMVYLMKKGFSQDEAMETVKLLAMNGAKIVKLVI